MGQSLADAAVRGTKSTQSIADQKQMLLQAGDIDGLIALNRVTFGGATMMAKKGDDADDDRDEDESDEDEDDDQDDEDDDEDEDDTDDKSVKAKDRRIQELSAESKRHRQKASQRGQRIRELEAENAQLKKGKSAPKKGKAADEDDEDDDSSEKVTELETTLEKQTRVNEDLLIRLEFTDLVTGPKAKHQFKSNKAALRLLDLSDVEVEEDGSVEGLEEAIEDLVKEHPYLLEDSEDEDDEDEEDKDKPKRRRTGQPAGGGRRKKKGTTNRDALVSKYPALRR